MPVYPESTELECVCVCVCVCARPRARPCMHTQKFLKLLKFEMLGFDETGDSEGLLATYLAF